MDKDFIKNTVVTTPPSTRWRARWRWLMLMVVLMLFALMFFLVAYYKKAGLWGPSTISGYYANINHWLSDRENHFNKKFVKVKHLSINKNDSDEQIHFEFYTTLSKEPLKTFNIAKSDNEPQKAIPVEEKPVKISTTNKLVYHEKALENVLSSKMKAKAYIVQLGVFHHPDSAERYRKMLIQSGLKVSLVKIHSGKQFIYRLQQGPFTDINAGKAAQKNLQKKGIACLLRSSTRFNA